MISNFVSNIAESTETRSYCETNSGRLYESSGDEVLQVAAAEAG